MILIMIWLLLLCLIILMSGLMAALFLIILLMFPLQVLGFFGHQDLNISGGIVGGVMLMVFNLILTRCIVRVFCSVPGPLQPVQRAEMWGVILALQTSRAVHLGVDNLGVVRHVGRLLDGCRGPVLFELVKDGDLLLLIDRMLHQRGLDTGRWYPVILDLHRFFIAISRAVVNHDGRGGTAPDPLVWSAGTLHKRRRLVHAVQDRAFLPGPPGIWCSEWFQIPAAVICAEDIALWPYTPGLLVKWVSILNSGLHWPIGDLDLEVGGVSYVELLIMYELWAGERLSLEKAHPRYLRPGCPISVSAVPFGPGIDIWRSCRFIGAMMRSLCLLPGGLRRFVPCSIGANHCRLRHIGWENCGHGLTSRPRESASELFLNELLSLFRYPPKSGRALLNGTLIVLLVLLTVPRLGGYRLLVMLIA